MFSKIKVTGQETHALYRAHQCATEGEGDQAISAGKLVGYGITPNPKPACCELREIPDRARRPRCHTLFAPSVPPDDGARCRDERTRGEVAVSARLAQAGPLEPAAGSGGKDGNS
jgi:hypothetical protein